MQDEIAIRKLQGYLERAKRTADTAVAERRCTKQTSPEIELRAIKWFIKDTIEEIHKYGINGWLNNNF